MAGYEIHTGNTGLATTVVHLNGHLGETIPFVLDSSVPDWQWRLCAHGVPISRPHDIGEHVASEVRRAVQHHQAKTTGVQPPSPEDEKPSAAPAVSEKPIQEDRAPTTTFCAAKGGQIAWQL